MERSRCVVTGLPNNVAAVRRTLEASGVEFANGDRPSVRMKPPSRSAQRYRTAQGGMLKSDGQMATRLRSTDFGPRRK